MPLAMPTLPSENATMPRRIPILLTLLPDSPLQCTSVHLLWILDTPQPGDMVERITRLVSHFSTRATAQQTVKKTAESQKEFVEFHDSRWPAWLTLDWTQEPASDSPP